MTTLGKILIFVNLVFSVVVGILICMVYARRTDWKQAHDKLLKVNEVNAALVRTYADEVRATKTACENEAKRITTERDGANRTIVDLKKQVETAEALHRTENEKLKLLANTNAHAAAELVQRRDEVQQLKVLMAQRDQQLITEQTEKKDLRDRYLRADIAARTSHNRTKELMETVERLTEDNDRLKGGKALAGTGLRKPPEDVRGLVTSIDAKNEFVTISIGSDAGLNKGNVLQVYRLSPEAKYFGELVIIEVGHHEAVGRLRPSQRTALLQKGDTVASSIMGTN